MNYIREQVNMGLVDIQKIAGEDNTADLHTKPLRDGTFEKHVDKILGTKRPLTDKWPVYPILTYDHSSVTSVHTVLYHHIHHTTLMVIKNYCIEIDFFF